MIPLRRVADARCLRPFKPFNPVEQNILQGNGPHIICEGVRSLDLLPCPGERVTFSFRLFSSVEDRNYRIILIIAAVYTFILTLTPIVRLVPRIPIPLFSFILIYIFYRLDWLPESIRQWLFYAFLVTSYWGLQFVVTSYARRFHGLGILQMERQIFGSLPTVWLQERLHGDGILSWYDYTFAVFHSSLFFLPILTSIALLIWRGSERMKRATVAFTLVSLAGYATYVLFPLTPPWMESIEGNAPEMKRIVFCALNSLTPDWLTGAFSPAPRGAMPSMHTGIPFLMAMIVLKEFGPRALWIAIPVLIIIFEIVYGAEHYVIDVVAGIAYAVIGYLMVYNWLIRDSRLKA